MDDEEHNGFSSKNRSYVTTLVFVALLVFDPVQPYGMVAKTVSLIALPGAVWLILRYLGSRWDLDAIANDRINRAITASIAGMFAVASYQAFTAKYHRECTRSVRDGDGSDCIGEWIAVAGPDQAQGLTWLFVAVLFFSYSVMRERKR